MSGRRGRQGKLGSNRSAHASKFHQRVAVRVTYSTNKTAGQWKAHGRYTTLTAFSIRRHAQELATMQLGYRTERDALEAQRREVQQLRFTSLDRIIQHSRSGDANYFTVRREPVGATPFARAHEHHVQARLVKLEQIGLAAKTASRTWLVRGDFEDILRTLQRTNDRQKMLARHAALVSDERLPLQVTPVPGISVLEGRVLGHGHDESSDRPYLLLEGVEGRIHLLWQNPDIEAKRRQGLLRVNSFARIEKHVAGGCSFLTVQDLGNSWKLLQNDGYFMRAAALLVRSGVQEIDRNWGGWVGAYQKKLSIQIIAMRDHEHQRGREISRGR